MCQQFLHLLLFGGQAHLPNYCVPVLRQVSSQSMTTAWDLMYARVKRICNFWESGEWVSEAQETIPCVLLTLVAGGRVGPGRAAVSTEPCVTMGSLYKQCWLLHAKKKKKMQQGIFSTLSCSTLCFLASTFKLCNNVYIQMLTVIFHPGKRRCPLKVPCVM